MPQVIETTIFQFDELSDRAKEKARDWYREGALDCDWWDSVYDDVERVADILGVSFDRDRRSNKAPAIYFSGFASQGDGACFEGTYSYARRAAKRIRKYAPQDAELHRIADCLQTIQLQAGYGLAAICKHRGHYSHSGCMTVDVEHTRGWNPELWEAQLTQLLRDFADWIYKQLEAEHDYLHSDENVDETIRANEYTFCEDGSRARV